MLRMWQSPSLSATASIFPDLSSPPGSDLQADLQEAGEYAGCRVHTFTRKEFPMKLVNHPKNEPLEMCFWLFDIQLFPDPCRIILQKSGKSPKKIYESKKRGGLYPWPSGRLRCWTKRLYQTHLLNLGQICFFCGSMIKDLCSLLHVFWVPLEATSAPDVSSAEVPIKMIKTKRGSLYWSAVWFKIRDAFWLEDSGSAFGFSLVEFNYWKMQQKGWFKTLM